MSQNAIILDGFTSVLPINVATATVSTTTLANLPIGSCARVIAVDGNTSIARRLLEMGVIPGAPVRIIKSAPFGDPIEVRVRGYHLALRRAEAQTITVVADVS